MARKTMKDSDFFVGMKGDDAGWVQVGKKKVRQKKCEKLFSKRGKGEMHLGGKVMVRTVDFKGAFYAFWGFPFPGLSYICFSACKRSSKAENPKVPGVSLTLTFRTFKMYREVRTHLKLDIVYVFVPKVRRLDRANVPNLTFDIINNLQITTSP